MRLPVDLQHGYSKTVWLLHHVEYTPVLSKGIDPIVQQTQQFYSSVGTSAHAVKIGPLITTLSLFIVLLVVLTCEVWIKINYHLSEFLFQVP